MSQLLSLVKDKDLSPVKFIRSVIIKTWYKN